MESRVVRGPHAIARIDPQSEGVVVSGWDAAMVQFDAAIGLMEQELAVHLKGGGADTGRHCQNSGRRSGSVQCPHGVVPHIAMGSGVKV